jgi:autotransporter-associated beta strand protein
MKTPILAAIRCSLMFLVPTVTYAISAQWDLDPISGDWNTAANWTPMSVPNGPADIATFDLSNTTDVSISANTEVNGITFTSAATNPYTITLSPGLTLTLSGTGITNNSGHGQTFVVGDINFGGAQMRFTNSASAGNAVIDMFVGDSINFFNRSTAASAFIDAEALGGGVGGGSINFFNSSTAGSAFINTSISQSSINFFNSSTAGSARIITFSVGSTSIDFFNNSTAGSATFDSSFGGAPSITFHDNATAGSAGIFTAFGSVTFSNHSTAGNASIGFFEGGRIEFDDSSTAGSAIIDAEGASVSFNGSSKGGTCQIELLRGGNLDISGHDAPGVTIGSIEGGGNISLGANNLTVGSNNLSTTFLGIIDDGGQGGSLTKNGSGTFILEGETEGTYTGDTNVNRGVLQVDGSITSNTFVNRAGTLAGTGTINANLTNNGRASPGSAGAPGMLTVGGNYSQAQFATLMIQIAGANAGEFGVLNVLGTANLGGQLDPVLLNGFVPTIGESFTFLTYGSVNGTLIMLNRNIDNLPEHWEVSYFPTFATLTVEPGNVSVPDQGSTFLLLTLGLLGLVTFRRQLVCKQS